MYFINLISIKIIVKKNYLYLCKKFKGTESNFEKRTPATSDNLGQPYDMGSVMHYGNFFTIKK